MPIDGPLEAQEDRRRTKMKLQKLFATRTVLSTDDTAQGTITSQNEGLRNMKLRATGQPPDEAARGVTELRVKTNTVQEELSQAQVELQEARRNNAIGGQQPISSQSPCADMLEQCRTEIEVSRQPQATGRSQLQ